MGETKYWDEFISPETHEVMTNYRIQFGKTFDKILEKLNKKAKNMNLKEIAANSKSGKIFDVKFKYRNVGELLNGKYATSRSAGNYLAGFNAQGSKMHGFPISFNKFQKLAGALHIENSHGKKLNKMQMFDIMMIGRYGGCSDRSKFVAPTWGEVYYQYRMSARGWINSKKQ